MASLWRRGCCFGLLGGSNQCGEATGFFADVRPPTDVTIQDYGFTKQDEKEWDAPIPLQPQLCECDQPGNDESFLPGVSQDDCDGIRSEMPRDGGQSHCGAVARTTAFQDHRITSEESTLHVEKSGQALSGELADGMQVLVQSTISGCPWCSASPVHYKQFTNLFDLEHEDWLLQFVACAQCMAKQAGALVGAGQLECADMCARSGSQVP